MSQHSSELRSILLQLKHSWVAIAVSNETKTAVSDALETASRTRYLNHRDNNNELGNMEKALQVNS